MGTSEQRHLSNYYAGLAERQEPAYKTLGDSADTVFFELCGPGQDLTFNPSNDFYECSLCFEPLDYCECKKREKNV